MTLAANGLDSEVIAAGQHRRRATLAAIIGNRPCTQGVRTDLPDLRRLPPRRRAPLAPGGGTALVANSFAEYPPLIRHASALPDLAEATVPHLLRRRSWFSAWDRSRMTFPLLPAPAVDQWPPRREYDD